MEMTSLPSDPLAIDDEDEPCGASPSVPIGKPVDEPVYLETAETVNEPSGEPISKAVGERANNSATTTAVTLTLKALAPANEAAKQFEADLKSAQFNQEKVKQPLKSAAATFALVMFTTGIVTAGAILFMKCAEPVRFRPLRAR